MKCRCCQCGVMFGSPVLRYRRKDGQEFYCPNGHMQSWKNVIDKENAAAEAAKLEEQKEVERLEAMYKLEPSTWQKVKDAVSGGKG